MTNIRTPIGFLSASAGSVACWLGYGAVLLPGTPWGASAVVTESSLLQPVAGAGLMQAHARVAAWWAT
jgi:hypothetical protein